MICLRDEQSRNDECPIVTISYGRKTLTNEEHFLNIFFSMTEIGFASEEGIFICSNEEQPSNADLQILMTEEGMMTCDNEKHS